MASRLRVVHRMGNSIDLPTSAGENELLYVEDTGRLYKGAGVDKPLISFSDVITSYATIEALKLANPAIMGKLYLTSDGVLSYYNGTDYVLVTGGVSTGGTVAESVTQDEFDAIMTDIMEVIS